MRRTLTRLVVTGALIAGGLTAVAAVPAAAASAPPAVDAAAATPPSVTQDWIYSGRFGTWERCASEGSLEVRYTHFTEYKCVYQPQAAYYHWELYLR